jgi:hypothetical protein
MDVHCSSCGEPWDTYHLCQDAIHETGLSVSEIEVWKKLPSDQRLTAYYRIAFKCAGYEFGRSLINVVRCPGCPSGAQPDPDKAHLKGELEEILAGDEDGLASSFEELGL